MFTRNKFNLAIVIAIFLFFIDHNHLVAKVAEITRAEVLEGFTRKKSTDVFVGYDVKFQIVTGAGQTVGVRFRQASESVYRVDVNQDRVIVRNDDLAFEARAPNGEFVFVDVGYGVEVREKIDDLALAKMAILRASTGGHPGNIESCLAEKAFQTCSESKSDKGFRQWDICSVANVDFGTNSHKATHRVSILPDQQYFVSYDSLIVGDPNATKEVDAQTVMKRADKSLKQDEKVVVFANKTSYEMHEGMLFPALHKNHLGQSWKLLSISPLESDLSIFAPESIGLETPARPSSRWWVWAVLSVAAFILGGFFILQQFKG